MAGIQTKTMQNSEIMDKNSFGTCSYTFLYNDINKIIMCENEVLPHFWGHNFSPFGV